VLCLQNVIAYQPAQNQQILSDSQGNNVAVWEAYDFISQTGVIQVTSQGFAGNWTPPLVLSDFNLDSTTSKIAINSIGDIVVIWSSLNLITKTYSLYGAIKPFGANWKPSVQISESEVNISDHKVTINDMGLILTSWIQTQTGNSMGRLAASNASVATGVWSAVTIISQ